MEGVSDMKGVSDMEGADMVCELMNTFRKVC